MNVKRHLKQQAQTDLQTIKDSDNGNTLKTLGVEYPTQQPKKRQTWSKWLFASMGAVLSLALVLCVVFLLPSQNTEPIYLEENEERIESNIDEANKSAHDFFLNIDESLYSIQTRKIACNFYVCGDLESAAQPGNGLMAPRVNICAAHQANLVLELLVQIKN